MKKVLGILAALTLTTVATTSVIACGTQTDPDEASSLEDRKLVRSEFIAEVKKIINNHINTLSRSLYFDKESASKKQYLNYDNLVKIVENKDNLKTITLSGDDFVKFKTDIDSILLITGNLADKIMSQIRENSRYNFLMVTIEQILSSFSLDSEITIRSQKSVASGSDDFLFTVDFSFEILFNYYWNDAVETETSGIFNLNYFIMTKELQDSGVVDVIQKLPQETYKNADAVNWLNLNDASPNLGALNYPFIDQSTRVEQRITNNRDDKDAFVKFSSFIETVTRSILSQQATIVFSLGGISTDLTEKMYSGEYQHTIKTNGYLEKAMLGKDIEGITDENIAEAWESEFSEEKLNKESFNTQAISEIEDMYNITLSPSDSNYVPFIQYGGLLLNDLVITVDGIEVKLNPINLLWTYAPLEKTYAGDLSNIFTTWRNLWGITASTDRNALFKVNTSTMFGQNFWKGENPEDPWLFTLRANGYFSVLPSSRSLSNFKITTSNGDRVANAGFDNKGFYVNYRSYAADNSAANIPKLTNSWQLVLELERDLVIKINFALNENYFNNIWLGERAQPVTRYVIEKG